MSSQAPQAPLTSNTPLHTALRNKQSLAAVKSLLSPEVLTVKNYDGETPLHTALRYGTSLEVTKLLTTPNILSEMNNSGYTPLTTAVHYGNSLEVITWLRDQEILYEQNRYYSQAPVPQVPAPQNDNSLHIALQNGSSLNELKLLVFGEIFDVEYNEKNIPSRVVSNNDVSRVLEIQPAPISIYAKDDDGNTPLHIALRYKLPHEIVELLAFEEILHMKNNNGDTPLHLALRYGCSFKTAVCLYTMEILTIENNNGDTPLHVALSHKNSFDVVKLLVYLEVLDMKNNDGYTPLYVALHNKYPHEIVNLLAPPSKFGPDVSLDVMEFLIKQKIKA